MKVNGQVALTLDGGGLVTIALDTDTLIDPADKALVGDLFKSIGYRVERPEGQEANDLAVLRAEFERATQEVATLRAACSQLEAAAKEPRWPTTGVYGPDQAFLGVVSPEADE